MADDFLQVLTLPDQEFWVGSHEAAQAVKDLGFRDEVVHRFEAEEGAMQIR